MIWANDFPGIPPEVDTIRYETLIADVTCMALSTIQGSKIIDTDILGNHKAEYQFKVIYRIKPGRSMDARLKADELLDGFGVWATKNKPNLKNGVRALKVETVEQATLFGEYDNGDEDHQILMKLTYEVI